MGSRAGGGAAGGMGKGSRGASTVWDAVDKGEKALQLAFIQGDRASIKSITQKLKNDMSKMSNQQVYMGYISAKGVMEGNWYDNKKYKMGVLNKYNKALTEIYGSELAKRQ